MILEHTKIDFNFRLVTQKTVIVRNENKRLNLAQSSFFFFAASSATKKGSVSGKAGKGGGKLEKFFFLDIFIK